MNVILSLVMDKDFVIYIFLMWLNKVEMWKLSDEFEVLDYICIKILICYNGIIGDGCGECLVCYLC